MALTNTSEASSLMPSLCGFSPLWDPELFWDPSGPRITPCLEQVGLPLFHLLFLLAVLPLEVNIYYIIAISSLVLSIISMYTKIVNSIDLFKIFMWRSTHVKSGRRGRLSFLLLLKIFTALLIMVRLQGCTTSPFIL